MTIKTITFSESVEIVNPLSGLKRWKKLSMEAELSPGEDEMKASISLSNKVNDSLFQMGANSLSTPESYNQPPPVIQVEKDKAEDERPLDEQIRSCTDLKELHSYKTLVKGKPEEKTYLIMLEQLQNKQP